MVIDLPFYPQRTAAALAVARLRQSAANLSVKRIARCAVVGNSGNLEGSGYGPLIDAHDSIFRMNDAPITGYENDIGTRTTHHILHSNHDWVSIYPDTTSFMIINEVNINHSYINDRFRYNGRVGASLKWLTAQLWPQQFPSFSMGMDADMKTDTMPDNMARLPNNLYIISPVFLNYVDNHWFMPENRTHHDYPSTGFKTLILALQWCDKVDVFGFGTNNQIGAWDHYYQDITPRFVNEMPHRADYQEQFLDEMEQRGIIRLYRGKREAAQ